jgi:hypothetical protein
MPYYSDKNSPEIVRINARCPEMSGQRLRADHTRLIASTTEEENMAIDACTPAVRARFPTVAGHNEIRSADE